MSYFESPDFDRPIPFDSGLLYTSLDSGTFRLAPSRCRVATRPDGLVAFQLDITRGLDRSSAMLTCDLTADYPTEAALAKAREQNDTARLSACVLTNWWFRVMPSAVLGAPIELTAPSVLASNGLGAAKIATVLPVETALVLESMLKGRAPLDGVAEAEFEGVSPRLSTVVRFESAALLEDLLTRSDSTGALPRQMIVDYFALDPSLLPIKFAFAVDAAARRRFAETMTDRLIAKYGRYVPSQEMSDAPVVALGTGADNSTLTWTLNQPFLATRRIVMPVNLLGDAQEQVARQGIASIVRRDSSAGLPSFGFERILAVCNLPASRSGVDALGVTLTFPPHPPFRPQAVTATAVFEAGNDLATIDVRLSPGEPLRYKYSTFAVLTDEYGTRQVDGPECAGEGPTLHLSTDQFPIEFAVIEVTPALAELAVVSGACTYEAGDAIHEQKFVFDSGHLSTAIAVPRERTSFSIDGYAVARTGSQSLRIGVIESLQATIDVTSFPGYGPQHIDVKCIFDDNATVQAVSLLPMDREESADNITVLSFTRAQPEKTFYWSSRSPFAPGFRYRPFNSPQGAWIEFPFSDLLLIYSSKMRQQERARVRRLESAAAGPAAPESAIDPAGVSPAADVTDLLLFDSVADASKKLYVPRYSLDMQNVSGQDRYRMSMAQRNAASTLEVNLVGAPDESLGDAARSATPYPHRVGVALDFLVSSTGGARKSLPFTEITRTDNLVKASLTFATLTERDDVYRALTEPAREARLIVQRHLDVRAPERPATGPTLGILTGPLLMALPIRPIMVMQPIALPQPPEPVATPMVTMTVAPALALAGVAMQPRTESTVATIRAAGPVLMTRATGLPGDVVLHPKGRFVRALPTPELKCTGTVESNGTTRCTLSVVNWKDFSDDFFAPSSDLPPCGLNKSSSRTWVDIFDADTSKRLYGYCALGGAKALNELSFGVPAGTTMPAHVNITLTDRRAKVTRTSNTVETAAAAPSAPATRDLRLQLDQAVAPAPFAFPPALHGYMFQGITPGTGSNQLIRYRLSWKGTFHTYLQDASRPENVYVFPDQFKIARRPDAPFSPFATVRVSSRPDGSNTDVVFDYVVAPYTDVKRLEAAQAQLIADARFGATHVAFQPFLTSDVRFFVDRPAVTGAVREQRPDAAVVLQGWLKDTLTMPLGDFRLLFDAMRRRTASLFLGRVEIDVPNESTETVPFSARMDDLAGDMLTYETTAVEDGALAVTARNDIESPLSVQALDAFVTWNGQRCRGLVQGAGLPTASLAPGATIPLTVTPEAPMPATAAPDVEFIPSSVTSIPDPDAIWDSILDRTTVDYFRIVTVQAVATLFEPVAGREAERIVSILLEFENGGTGELESTSLEAQVRVDYPIDDVVLGRPVPTSYRYTVTVVRADGRQDRDAAPRVSSASTFFVSVTR